LLVDLSLLLTSGDPDEFQKSWEGSKRLSVHNDPTR